MTNKIIDIVEIHATEDNTIIIFFIDGKSIETTEITFNQDGTFELGYIY